MGMTMTQKILAAHCGEAAVTAGQLINAQLDIVLGNDITTPVAINEFEKAGFDSVFDRTRVNIVLDHFVPNKDIKSATQSKQCRQFADKYDILNFYDVGEMGVEHALLPEKGIVTAGDCIIGVTLGCFLANLLGSTVIDVIFGTLATLVACLVTYKLRDVRIKGLAIPASLPPVIFNMIIVGAFEITFFFSDSAPTAAMAAFNAVTVGIGEVISCTILGVALVKLIETNASLKKIFTEE